MYLLNKLKDLYGGLKMDRRQRKTRKAIFDAFIELLSNKKFNQITVAEIIEKADVGRATFYSHFETKDYLLKELCKELFCHIFDSIHQDEKHHKHIFDCNPPASVFLHLFTHLQQNDNQILQLLTGENDTLFLDYFKSELRILVEHQSEIPIRSEFPKDFWLNHVTSTCLETIRWWFQNGLIESPQMIVSYIFSVLQ